MTVSDMAERESDPSPIVPCARHPRVETALRCGRCGTPICPRCLIQTPVGARCPTCAQVKRFVTVAKPRDLVRGVVGGLGMAAIGGLILQLIPFLGWFGVAILGYLVGELVSLGVNRKRGKELAVLGIVCFILGLPLGFLLRELLGGRLDVVLLVGPMLYVSGLIGEFSSVPALLGLGVGSLLLWMRLR